VGKVEFDVGGWVEVTGGSVGYVCLILVCLLDLGVM